MNRRIYLAMSLAGACLFQTGCSIFSPIPLWELAKATGAAASTVIPYGSSQASNTVYHLHPQVKKVCIEFNPVASVPDVVPALQIELQKHQVDSRVYEAWIPLDECEVWLKYSAYIAWDIPPMSSDYRAYVTRATLTLRSSNGSVLSSSNYELGTGFGVGKWASAQSKLAPVVTALLTGFQS
jgi:hypothetical protein